MLASAQQEFGWNSLTSLTLLLKFKLAGHLGKTHIMTNPCLPAPQFTTEPLQGLAEEMNVKNVVNRGACMLKDLPYSWAHTSQPLNNWRNYQASGSKAPQKCVMPLSKACRKEKKKRKVRFANSLLRVQQLTTKLSSVPPTLEVTTQRLMMPQMVSFDRHSVNTS